jgi:hypothetical protein
LIKVANAATVWRKVAGCEKLEVIKRDRRFL